MTPGREAPTLRTSRTERTGPFAKRDRIVGLGEFKRVYHRGYHASSDRFGCYALPTRRAASRLGISVSRKYGGAPARNRVKRLAREAFRRVRGRLPGPVDVVLVPRRAARDADLDAVARELETLVARALEQRRRRR